MDIASSKLAVPGQHEAIHDTEFKATFVPGEQLQWPSHTSSYNSVRHIFLTNSQVSQLFNTTTWTRPGVFTYRSLEPRSELLLLFFRVSDYLQALLTFDRLHTYIGHCTSLPTRPSVCIYQLRSRCGCHLGHSYCIHCGAASVRLRTYQFYLVYIFSTPQSSFWPGNSVLGFPLDGILLPSLFTNHY